MSDEIRALVDARWGEYALPARDVSASGKNGLGLARFEAVGTSLTPARVGGLNGGEVLA